jgi:type II secretory pathway component GspD/PulD (secretin)
MKASTSLLLASLTLTAIVPCAALAQDDYGDLDGDEPTKKTTTKQRKRPEVREITRGFYAKSNVGGSLYLGQFAGTVNPGTNVALGFGQDFLDQERQRVTQVLGTDAVGTAQRLLEREVAIVPEQVSNTLLLSASPRYFDQIHEIIEELDQPQSQVLIQVMLAEVTLDSTRDLGFEWSFAKNVGGGWNVGTGTDFALPSQTLYMEGGDLKLESPLGEPGSAPPRP